MVKSKNPLVSVIVPVYNVEKYIDTCLLSIINQTYKNLEIVVVNDASPGDIKHIIKSYQEKYDSIRLINLEKNLGTYLARVRGLEAATGEYVTNIDGDDTICIDYIERLVNRAKETDSDVVISEMMTLNEKTREKQVLNSVKSVRFDEIISGRGLALSELVRKNNFFWEVSGKLYRAAVVRMALPELSAVNKHLIMGEDMLFNFHVFYYANSLSKAEFAFYNYLINDSSITSRTVDVDKKEKTLNDLIYIFDHSKKFLQEKGVFDKYSRQYRYIRNMQAAKYYFDIKENFPANGRARLLRVAEALSNDKTGMGRELTILNDSKYDSVKDLQWRLESMNSVKLSGLKFLSNVKRKLKSLI